jgi:hypothetical protein
VIHPVQEDPAFDNVDKRSRDLQLQIFEAAQWLKDKTKALVIVNLRDSTFEAHRDEPPLDAFANAINFYIRPPRFAQVIRKRLELVLEAMSNEIEGKQEYSLSTGYKVQYPSTQIGEFLMILYLSLFDQRSIKVASTLEALVAKDIRRALGMFADILVSPHIPTSKITGAILSSGNIRIPEYLIIRALMRQRYRYYNENSTYIRNLLTIDLEHTRPSNFLYVDILEYLIRNRKTRIDFSQEGYASLETIVKVMGSCGYADQDVKLAVRTLVDWGLIEPESLVSTQIDDRDAVRMHATGFIHMRFFLERVEYLVGISVAMSFSSKSLAEEVAGQWSGSPYNTDLSLNAKIRVLRAMKEYLEQEYDRRCRRHPFYSERGFGGQQVVQCVNKALINLENTRNQS